MVMRPTLSEFEAPPAPTNDITASTFGSCRTISATWRCNVTIASNEMSCGPSTKHSSCRCPRRQEALWGAREENPGSDADGEERQHDHAPMMQRPAQAHVVGVLQGVECALERHVHPSVPLILGAA